jgi:threonine dehydratase
MAIAFEHFNLVVEPGGAVALAAVLSQAVDIRGRTAAVVCSGGNVDKDLYCRALRGELGANQAPDPGAPA